MNDPSTMFYIFYNEKWYVFGLNHFEPPLQPFSPAT